MTGTKRNNAEHDDDEGQHHSSTSEPPIKNNKAQKTNDDDNNNNTKNYNNDCNNDNGANTNTNTNTVVLDDNNNNSNDDDDDSFIHPMKPRLDPFASHKNNNDNDNSMIITNPYEKVEQYVLYLAIRESKHSKFTQGLRKCRQACTDKNIHTTCFQRDESRHVTLWTGSMTVSNASKIRFRIVDSHDSSVVDDNNNNNNNGLPTKPIPIAFSGLTNWKSGVYLQLTSKTTQTLKDLLEKLDHYLPTKGRKCDHLSLYRKRQAVAGSSNNIKSNAVYQEFARIRKALASHEWDGYCGAVEGVSIRLKQLGTGYDECRVLWSAE